MVSVRNQKVAENIRKALAFCLQEEIYQAAVQNIPIVAIERVVMSSDLSLATAYCSIIHGDPDILKMLNIARIRKKLASKLQMRFVPQIRLRHEESSANIQRIENLLKNIIE